MATVKNVSKWPLKVQRSVQAIVAVIVSFCALALERMGCSSSKSIETGLI